MSNQIDAAELCTLVRLFGDRVRIDPDGRVTIERQTAAIPSDGEKTIDRPAGARDR